MTPFSPCSSGRFPLASPGLKSHAASVLLLLLLTFLPGTDFAVAKLSPIAPKPDWSALNAYQETITREDFLNLLNRVYAPNGSWKKFITCHETDAIIRTGGTPFRLRFASARDTAKAVPSYWRSRRMLPHVEPGKPLAGLKIALDPGHLGGQWAKMEERWFQIGSGKPVAEGDMTLAVAKLMVPQLEKLGAEVFLTRSKAAPVTSLRPSSLKKTAAASLADQGVKPTAFHLQKERERLFYRVAEIRRRARLVNETIRPDLVICLHFNAEDWRDPANPSLVNDNHLHFLVSGALSEDELGYEDQLHDMLIKLLSRSFAEEIAVTDQIARKMTTATGLPPFIYRGSNALSVNDSSYIWARNLLANRLFSCPVIYVEPYVMNNRNVYARIQAGDYPGLKKIGGAERKSIYREYADAIVDGLTAYYSNRPL